MEYSDTIRPLLISEKRLPSEVRRHTRALAAVLAEQVAPELGEDRRVLFVFILRGAMLLYVPFAERFEAASFAFLSGDSLTPPNCRDYDTAVIVDTVVETGRTVTAAVELLSAAGISAKRRFCACVCANESSKEKLSRLFDRVFCLEYMENVRVTIDAGQFAACGDDAQAE